MPEGPSILILKNLLLPLKGTTIVHAKGNAKINMNLLTDATIMDIRTFGKQLFIVTNKNLSIRIHLLMFGTYSFDEQIRQDRSVRLCLELQGKTVYFYTCSVRLIEGNIEKLYNWRSDVLSDAWDPKYTRKKVKEHPEMMACDALMNQEIFTGVGNIIKNEVLFRIKLHPETLIKNIPPRKLTELINESRNYSFDFLKWKQAYVLKKHWLAHTKKTCVHQVEHKCPGR